MLGVTNNLVLGVVELESVLAVVVNDFVFGVVLYVNST